MKKEFQKYFHWGLTIFLTACALLVFYDVFYTGGSLQRFFSKLSAVLAPVLNGLVMAYLLSPVLNLIERTLQKIPWKKRKGTGRKPKNPQRAKGWLRAISILLTWSLVLVLLYLLLLVLIPQLIDSVATLIGNAEGYYKQIYDWAKGLVQKNPEFSRWASGMIDRYYKESLSFLTDKILPGFQGIMTSITGGIWVGIWSVVNFTKNLLIGVIVSIYLLARKEESFARCRKLMYCIFKDEQTELILRGTRRMDSIFSGFVRGKLLDSLLIGVLCFIGCSILGIPYTPLVSVIVGVTNIIPFFGPILGAAPSGLLIFLVSPLKCLYFVIFIIVLQQLDGNVIGPKILGNSTGISSFWVIVAILVGGGFGGITGMFLGVPLVACLQVLVKYLMDLRIQKKKAETPAEHLEE